MRSSLISHDGPTTSWIAYWLGRLWMWWFGWNVEGEPEPNTKKAILIACPHTTNWDLPFMLATAFIFRLDVSWLGKHTLFRPPLGWLLRWLRGLPVDRRAPNGAVKQVAEHIGRAERIALAVPPSGTRSKGEYWKSGFYWMAHTAGVPIMLGFLDYQKKTSGIGPTIPTTGDIKKDMDKIRAFYADKQGLYPEMKTTICLRDEEGPPAKQEEPPKQGQCQCGGEQCGG